MAMGKPFSMQAPEDVAKEYGGNKQNIAKAAQMGLLDPTTAVMAGMFIDRMREAQAEEQQQTATVAEQVFSPQPAPQGMPAQPPMPQGMPQGMSQPRMSAQMPQGMGATPQAAQMQAMQQKMAPRPSVAGMNQLPMGPGMIPRAASGGLLAFADGGDVPGYAPGGAPSRYGDLTEEDIIRLENNARLYEEANPSSLSDALVPIINPDDEASINASVLDPRYGLKNSDELSPRDTTREMLRSEELSKLNGEIEKQREIVARRGGGFDDDFDPLGGTPGAGAQARLNELIAKRDALTGTGAGLGTSGSESFVVPDDPFADIDYNPPNQDIFNLTEEADLNAIGKETPEVTSEVAPEVASEIAPEVAPEVASEVASETETETETKTKQDDQTKREIEALFDGIVVPEDTTDSEFKKLRDALGTRDTKYEDYLQTEEYLADKAKKEDLYTAMAEFGFRMAASDSPYALQAAGQAGAATAPSVKEALKDARARKKDAKEKLALNEVAKRQEKLNLLKAASDRATGGAKMRLDAQIAKAQKELGLYVANLNADTQRAILTADKKDEKGIKNRLANLKTLRDEQGQTGKYFGLSDAQLEAIARTEARTRVDSSLTRDAAQLKMDLDMQKAIYERIPQLRASQDPLFLGLKTFEEQYAYAEQQVKKELARARNMRKTTTARNPDADAARINQGL